ncbi:putative methyltransferase-like protein 15 [Acipenser ruthenus]|uniref:Putative methyltransferase-like protein 15 n=1 Tax=Acipenser ruthenus TaxID=7906 RepID=A0A444UH56_ACIRT|nr:putative methyltransferase-like protein 15 [Acipenser ruthenus]
MSDISRRGEITAGDREKTATVPVKMHGFDGTDSWEAFQMQLEKLTELHSWSEMERTSRLIGALKGDEQLLESRSCYTTKPWHIAGLHGAGGTNEAKRPDPGALTVTQGPRSDREATVQDSGCCKVIAFCSGPKCQEDKRFVCCLHPCYEFNRKAASVAFSKSLLYKLRVTCWKRTCISGAGPGRQAQIQDAPRGIRLALLKRDRLCQINEGAAGDVVATVVAAAAAYYQPIPENLSFFFWWQWNQFDNPEMGFSLSKDSPLDMRIDSNSKEHCSAMYLSSIMYNADIVFTESFYFTNLVSNAFLAAFPAVALYTRRDLLLRPAHEATKTIQALQIFLNDELNELYARLRCAEGYLKPGAAWWQSASIRWRTASSSASDVAAPHNLNVHQKVRQSRRGGVEQHGGEAEEVEAEQGDDEEQSRGPRFANWHHVQKKVLTPDPQEVLENPHERSAKLRAAQKQ